MDKRLYEAKSLTFHPMQNDALTEISTEDFKKFLAAIGKTANVVDFAQLKKEAEAESPEGGAKKEGEKKPAGKKGGKKPGKEEKKGEQKEEEYVFCTMKKQKHSDIHKLGIEYSKADNWPMWYQQVIKKSEMIEYCNDVSGCYVLRPWSYAIWERVQSYLDARFKEHGVENAYFPMFVTKSALEKEKSHVEGFKAEVAWVTKSGDTDLQEPIAIRPTSETIMYPYYQKWIRSHRDLPLKLNQWTNIVRWEFKDPTPFIRTREFLWQEGHTAHASLAEADKMVQDMLEVYKNAYEKILAVPVIKGMKSEEEKFPGARYTTSVEAVILSNGRGVQAATSHNLGQNFSKMFEIYFENEKGEKELAWQTSWGFTTRSIGIMILMHGDNKGLILPPRVAPIQVVMVPIHYTTEEREKLLAKMKEFEQVLGQAGVRTKVDDRTVYRPGWKFNYWELKGVPLRIEFGMKDYAASSVTVVRRDTGEKKGMKWENLAKSIPELLEQFQNDLFERAKKGMGEAIVKVDNWADFMKNVNQRKSCIAPWCRNGECETKVKAKSKEESKKYSQVDPTIMTGSVKTLNIPFETEPLKEGEKCFHCGAPAVCRALWGRSY